MGKVAPIRCSKRKYIDQTSYVECGKVATEFYIRNAKSLRKSLKPDRYFGCAFCKEHSFVPGYKAHWKKASKKEYMVAKIMGD